MGGGLGSSNCRRRPMYYNFLRQTCVLDKICNGCLSKFISVYSDIR